MYEPTMLSNDTAYIMPHARNKGGAGYIIQPKTLHPSFILNEDEMAIILAVYTKLLERKAICGTVEQPQIIKCIDCKWREENHVLANGQRICGTFGVGVSSDDYCSWAERKDDDK